MSSQNKYTSLNSFYHLGGIEILTFVQDELSKLWKFYLSTPEHYVVSREFDKSKGLYANAPEEVIRKGLMDFSASILGEKLSLFAIMDMFIDRCFDDSVFDKYTTNALWLSLDNPSYDEVEDILGTYGCRVIWARDFDDPKYPILGDCVNRLLYKTPPHGYDREKLLKELFNEIKSNKITTIFLNPDKVVEDVLSESSFDGMPTFIGEFNNKNDDTFTGFKYIGH